MTWSAPLEERPNKAGSRVEDPIGLDAQALDHLPSELITWPTQHHLVLIRGQVLRLDQVNDPVDCSVVVYPFGVGSLAAQTERG